MVGNIAKTPREGFMREVNAELLKFERREGEFRKMERQERAAKLQLPLGKYDSYDSRDSTWRRSKTRESDM